MSIVRDLALLPDALVTARRVAESAFGDSTLLLEVYRVTSTYRGSNFGDTLGHVVHCFERECSIQRRFQKVIEEAPSEAIDESLRQRFCHAAVTAGEALGYVGAGTVEFIMSPDGEFYFLEVNTRLQVEHPVTEMITGLDLVEWQLRVASGEALPAQETITRTGHAIEARIYAEDPQNEFLPATGQLLAWRFEDEVSVRIDSGVEAGSTIGIDYDPMLAKVITVAPDRHTAIRSYIERCQRHSWPVCKPTDVFSWRCLKTNGLSRAILALISWVSILLNGPTKATTLRDIGAPSLPWSGVLRIVQHKGKSVEVFDLAGVIIGLYPYEILGVSLIKNIVLHTGVRELAK